MQRWKLPPGLISVISHHHSMVQKVAGIAQRYIENGSLTEEDAYLLNEIREQDHPFQHLKIDWHSNLEDK